MCCGDLTQKILFNTTLRYQYARQIGTWFKWNSKFSNLYIIKFYSYNILNTRNKQLMEKRYTWNSMWIAPEYNVSCENSDIIVIKKLMCMCRYKLHKKGNTFDNLQFSSSFQCELTYHCTSSQRCCWLIAKSACYTAVSLHFHDVRQNVVSELLVPGDSWLAIVVETKLPTKWPFCAIKRRVLSNASRFRRR